MIPPALLVAMPVPTLSLSATIVMAQDATQGFDAGTLGQYGVLGIVNVILFRFAQQAYNREKDRADAADSEVKRLNQKIQDEYVGSLEKANEALHESSQTLAAFTAKEPPPRRRS